MNENNQNEVFDEYYESIFKKSNTFDKASYDKQCLAYEINLLPLLPKNKSAKFLDIGCGCGHFLYSLNHFGYHNVYGIDLSVQQIEHCKKHVTDQAVVADPFEFLKDKEGVFDCITMITVLEHVPKKQTLELLKLIHKSLKKEGTFIAVVPNMNNPFASSLRYRDFSHETCFNEISLEQVFYLAGFHATQMRETKIYVHSFKTGFRDFLLKMYYRYIKFLYYFQDFAVPKVLSPRLIGVGKAKK